ncbi:HSP90 family protein [Brevibacterium sp. 91QC2O2]|uniref:HSP90 family protein n=1 Tax=Brevibacterium sp. 91QC2O2 TaxID=2968458 RepID=UPI00211C92C5|nr:HSP90 family protein [Brevibacterium sp. 91QC2O2]
MTNELTRPFQVHLRGVVELLSRSIYSGPQVYLRELMQNAHDAIAARRAADGGGSRMIITPLGPGQDYLQVADDGIGLTGAEVSDLLATVGRSSKRDFLDLPRSDRLGQFGIGLLSCFMIADEITVLSRSAAGGPGVEWTGRADGTFTVRETDEPMPVGTRVRLRPRGDDADLAREKSVFELARRFGEYLPTPVDVVRVDGREQRINRAPVFCNPAQADASALLELGEELIGARPIEAIPLDVPATGTTGVAYVLPYAPAPGARQATRAYLGGMLLSERLDDLLPEWGFFVRCVVNTTGLHPTAAREALIEDAALDLTRDAIGDTLRRWVLSIAATRPAALSEFLAIHQLGLKAVAVHDEELADLLLPHLRFETSAGPALLTDLVRAHPRLRYTTSVDEFRQLSPLAAPDAPLVNAGYVYDEALLHRLPEIVPGAVVVPASATELVDALAEPPLAERPAVTAFEARCTAALDDVDTGVTVRCFAPADVAAVYVVDGQVLEQTTRAEVARESGGLFGSLLSKLAAAPAGPVGRLCLNWHNRLVRTLAESTGPAFAPTVRVLYVQALMAGRRSLERGDRRILDRALTDIVTLSVESPDPTGNESPDPTGNGTGDGTVEGSGDE